MTLLDDDIEDLLQAFRADEARLDDATRARMWTRICDEVPDAPTALDTLDPRARVRRLRRRTTPRVLAVAAAVLVLLAVAGLVVRSGPDDGDVTAGPPTTIPIPRDLWELADRVTALTPPVLGRTPDATYTYRRAVRTVQGDASTEPVIQVQEQWIDRDGAGRVRITGDDPGDRTMDAPGSLTIGTFAPAAVVAWPDDADAVAAAVAEQTEDGTFSATDSPSLVQVLTYTGLPGPARAGVLRALDRLGFVLVPASGLGPNVVHVEGPGPDGSTMQANLDLRTGQAIATTAPLSGGGSDRLTSIEVDLRRDTQGS